MGGLTLDKLTQLKDNQGERVNLTRSFWVAPWDCEVEIRQLTPNEMILADKAGFTKDPDGRKERNDEMKKLVIVLMGVNGLEPVRDKEFLSKEPAGLINDLFREIMEFSGFNESLEDVIKEKKKA